MAVLENSNHLIEETLIRSNEHDCKIEETARKMEESVGRIEENA